MGNTLQRTKWENPSTDLMGKPFNALNGKALQRASHKGRPFNALCTSTYYVGKPFNVLLVIIAVTGSIRNCYVWESPSTHYYMWENCYRTYSKLLHVGKP